MYKIDQTTGKYPFLSNWYYFMQSEINHIQSYVEISEDAHNKASYTNIKSQSHHKVENLDDDIYDLFTLIFGAIVLMANA